MNKDILNIVNLKKELKESGLNIAAIFADCKSTQKYAHDISVAKDTVILALEQKEGIGRLNRKFISRNGGCYFSLVLPNKREKNVLHFVPVISVAIATVINSLGLKAEVKWPNDILVNGKKICGILCSSHYDKIIIGAGINVFNDISDVAEVATSLYLEGVKNVTRAEIIAKVLKQFYDLVQIDFEVLNKNYKQFLNIKGKDITVTQNGDTIKGRVEGINKDGFLKIKNKNGEMIVMSGDITIN